jgi:hypothetical protein
LGGGGDQPVARQLTTLGKRKHQFEAATTVCEWTQTVNVLNRAATVISCHGSPYDLNASLPTDIARG